MRFAAPAVRFALAVVNGALLHTVVGLEPSAALVWVVPALVLVLAWRTPSDREASWLTRLSAAIGYAGSFSTFSAMMSPWWAVAVIAGKAALFAFVVIETRRAARRFTTGWLVLAYPVLWVAVDTLMTAVLPDGNYASLGYSQGDVLPVTQLGSLFGVSGVLLVISLVPSSLALAATFGWPSPVTRQGLLVTVIAVSATLVFGSARLATAPRGGTAVTFGWAAIDDAIGLEASPAYVESIRGQYDRHLATLASQGARVILLPEKIAVLNEVAAAEWVTHFAALAGQHQVWLIVGVTVDLAGAQENRALVFSPEGALVATYLKHHRAPAERGSCRPGTEFTLANLEGVTTGVGICKDLHFATFAHEYQARGAALVVVPSWDWGFDGWITARMAAMRAIENGYVVIRNSREGLLSAFDAQGRPLAETRSAPLPGATLLAQVFVPTPRATVFSVTGNVLGWVCVVAAAALMYRSRRRTTATE